MISRDSWSAVKKLLTDVADSVRETDSLRLLEDFNQLVPFNRCLLWWWKVEPGELMDSQDLHHFTITRDDQGGFQVNPVRDKNQKVRDADHLFSAYSSFLEEEAGDNTKVFVFRAYSGEATIKGFGYNPDAQGGYSALITKFYTNGILDEPERIHLFECSLPVLHGLSERWAQGENRANGKSEILSLTNRQKAILDHLQEGKRTPDIADHLGVSDRTVSWHLQNIYRKLNVCNRQQAIVTVQNLNIITD